MLSDILTEDPKGRSLRSFEGLIGVSRLVPDFN